MPQFCSWSNQPCLTHTLLLSLNSSYPVCRQPPVCHVQHLSFGWQMSLNLGDLYKHDLRPPNNNPLYQVGQFQGCEQLHDFLSTLNGRQTSQADVSQIPHCAHQSVSPVQNDYLLSSKMIHLLLVHFSTVLIILSLYPLLFTCPEPKQYKRCRPTDPNSDSPAPTGADYMAVQVRFHGKSPSLFHFFKNHCMHQLKGRFSC